jgi:hypothetical protein
MGPEGNLKAKLPDKGKTAGENRETLSNYRPGNAEREQGKLPRRVMDLQNSYGCISAAVDEKMEPVLVVTRTNTRGLHALPHQSKELEDRSAVTAPGVWGEFYFNGKAEKESAVKYHEEEQTNGPFLLRRLKSMLFQTGNATTTELLGFLDTREEKQAAKALRKEKQNSLQMDGSRTQALDRDIQHADALCQEKERQQNRFLKQLERFESEARLLRNEGNKTEAAFFRLPVELATEGDMDGNESGDTAEENNSRRKSKT